MDKKIKDGIVIIRGIHIFIHFEGLFWKIAYISTVIGNSQIKMKASHSFV